MDLLDRVAPLIGPRAVVLLSGGRDSVCLLDCTARAVETGSDPASREVVALHVDYGLRPDAAADAAFCSELCERLGVELVIERPRGPTGNVQAWARERRYAAGRALAEDRDAELLAGHTASDQVETVLYRLAAAPGRRALLGMPARDGRLVRPLLGCTREETAAHCRARGLPWREDASNDDRAYARNRVRHELMAALRSIHPAAEANLLGTLEILRDEAAVLDAVVEAALRGAGWDGAGGGVDAAALRALRPALRRLALQRLADAAAGGRAPAVAGRADEVLALQGGTRELHLGGGLRAVMTYGELRVVAGVAEPVPAPAVPLRLPLPGRVAFAGGELTAELAEDGDLDAAALGPEVEVRAWRAGDRMRPAGLGGTRTLQDLFTDRKVPRARRARTPVVVAGDRIAWVPGVATGEGFQARPGSGRRARLRWVGF